MKSEIINRIELLDSGELLLGLEGDGDPTYQHIYRAAAGVNWEEKLNGFKSTELKNWSTSQWFSHIIKTVKSEIGIDLKLSKKASWENVPKNEKHEIISNNAI